MAIDYSRLEEPLDIERFAEAIETEYYAPRLPLGEATRLQVVADESQTLPASDTGVVTESYFSRDSVREGLRSTLELRRSERISLANKNDYYSLTDKDKEHLSFFGKAFTQSIDIPESGRNVKAKHYHLFNEQLGKVHTVLKAIDEELSPDILKPDSYVKSGLKHSAPYWARNIVEDLRKAKIELIQTTSRILAPTMLPQEIDEGLLDEPPFLPQDIWPSSEKACANANFRMVFAAATGEKVDERVVTNALRDVHRKNPTQNIHVAGGHITPDDDYLMKTFQTEAFQQRYPQKSVSVTNFHGFDFETIATLAGGIRAKNPDDPNLKILCALNIASTSMGLGSGVWHNVMLLSADDKSVTFHDPSASHPKARAKMDKEDFIDHWGQTYFAGHLIVATDESPTQMTLFNNNHYERSVDRLAQGAYTKSRSKNKY